MEKMAVEERLREVQSLYEDLLNSSNLGKSRDFDGTPRSRRSNNGLDCSKEMIPISEKKEEYEIEDPKPCDMTHRGIVEDPRKFKDHTGLDHQAKNRVIKQLMFDVYFYNARYKVILRRFNRLDVLNTSPACSKNDISTNLSTSCYLDGISQDKQGTHTSLITP